MKYVIIILFIILIIVFIKFRFINTHFVKNCRDCLSLTICGKRGSGKSCLSSYLAYGIKHNSNIPLQKNTNIISVRSLNIDSRLNRTTFTNIQPGESLNIDFSKFKHFNKCTFIDDAQIYFPNYEDNILKKEYLSLPNAYCIWRHLFDSGLIFNIQIGGRLWKLLREQIEDTIKVEYVKWFPIYAFMKIIYYEYPEDCEKNLKPIHSLISNAEIKVENSARGEIKVLHLLIPRRFINHNTRYFRYLVFNHDSIKNSYKKRGGVK